MRERRWSRGLVGVAVLLYAAPLLVLPLRALADVWRAPAVLPQQLGMRGLAYAATPATGVPAAFANSLVVALMTTAVALILAWPAARVVGRRSGGSRVLFVVLAVPLLVPPLAVGSGLATWLLRWGLADTLVGVGVSHLIYVLPYVALILSVGFTTEVEQLEEAARALGAGALRRLVQVTVPAVAPALAAALLLGFVVSWSQYGTSLAVGGGIPMLPLILVPFVPTDPQVASTLAVLFLGPPVALLGAAVALGRAR